MELSKKVERIIQELFSFSITTNWLSQNETHPSFPLHAIPPLLIRFPEVIFACHQNCQWGVEEEGKIFFVQYLSIDQIPIPLELALWLWVAAAAAADDVN